MRGLAACARLQGQYRQAIKHLERVLEISNDMRDHVGDAGAQGMGGGGGRAGMEGGWGMGGLGGGWRGWR